MKMTLILNLLVIFLTTILFTFLSTLFKFKNSNKLNTFSAGLLIGTSLGVVLPEGFESLPSNYEDHQVGLIVVLGYILMLIIDTLITPHNHNSSDEEEDENIGSQHSSPPTGNANSNNSAISHHQSTQIPTRMRSYTPLRPNTDMTLLKESTSRAISKTIGLSIHSLCDGIALGSASYSQSSSSLSFIVFLAIAIHKAPASFGLATSLLSLSPSIKPSFLRLCIFLFAISAPFSAIVTYGILNFLNIENNDDSLIPSYSLLFSGGSFLFVASQSTSESVNRNNNSTVFLKYFILGIVIPILISLFISH